MDDQEDQKEPPPDGQESNITRNETLSNSSNQLAVDTADIAITNPRIGQCFQTKINNVLKDSGGVDVPPKVDIPEDCSKTPPQAVEWKANYENESPASHGVRLEQGHQLRSSNRSDLGNSGQPRDNGQRNPSQPDIAQSLIDDSIVLSEKTSNEVCKSARDEQSECGLDNLSCGGIGSGNSVDAGEDFLGQQQGLRVEAVGNGHLEIPTTFIQRPREPSQPNTLSTVSLYRKASLPSHQATKVSVKELVRKLSDAGSRPSNSQTNDTLDKISLELLNRRGFVRAREDTSVLKLISIFSTASDPTRASAPSARDQAKDSAPIETRSKPDSPSDDNFTNSRQPVKDGVSVDGKVQGESSSLCDTYGQEVEHQRSVTGELLKDAVNQDDSCKLPFSSMAIDENEIDRLLALSARRRRSRLGQFMHEDDINKEKHEESDVTSPEVMHPNGRKNGSFHRDFSDHKWKRMNNFKKWAHDDRLGKTSGVSFCPQSGDDFFHYQGTRDSEVGSGFPARSWSAQQSSEDLSEIQPCKDHLHKAVASSQRERIAKYKEERRQQLHHVSRNLGIVLGSGFTEAQSTAVPISDTDEGNARLTRASSHLSKWTRDEDNRDKRASRASSVTEERGQVPTLMNGNPNTNEGSLHVTSPQLHDLSYEHKEGREDASLTSCVDVRVSLDKQTNNAKGTCPGVSEPRKVPQISPLTGFSDTSDIQKKLIKQPWSDSKMTAELHKLSPTVGTSQLKRNQTGLSEGSPWRANCEDRSCSRKCEGPATYRTLRSSMAGKDPSAVVCKPSMSSKPLAQSKSASLQASRTQCHGIKSFTEMHRNKTRSQFASGTYHTTWFPKTQVNTHSSKDKAISNVERLTSKAQDKHDRRFLHVGDERRQLSSYSSGHLLCKSSKVDGHTVSTDGKTSTNGVITNRLSPRNRLGPKLSQREKSSSKEDDGVLWASISQVKSETDTPDPTVWGNSCKRDTQCLPDTLNPPSVQQPTGNDEIPVHCKEIMTHELASKKNSRISPKNNYGSKNQREASFHQGTTSTEGNLASAELAYGPTGSREKRPSLPQYHFKEQNSLIGKSHLATKRPSLPESVLPTTMRAMSRSDKHELIKRQQDAAIADFQLFICKKKRKNESSPFPQDIPSCTSTDEVEETNDSTISYQNRSENVEDEGHNLASMSLLTSVTTIASVEMPDTSNVLVTGDKSHRHHLRNGHRDSKISVDSSSGPLHRVTQSPACLSLIESPMSKVDIRPNGKQEASYPSMPHVRLVDFPPMICVPVSLNQVPYVTTDELQNDERTHRVNVIEDDNPENSASDDSLTECIREIQLSSDLEVMRGDENQYLETKLSNTKAENESKNVYTKTKIPGDPQKDIRRSESFLRVYRFFEVTSADRPSLADSGSNDALKVNERPETSEFATELGEKQDCKTQVKHVETLKKNVDDIDQQNQDKPTDDSLTSQIDEDLHPCLALIHKRVAKFVGSGDVLSLQSSSPRMPTKSDSFKSTYVHSSIDCCIPSNQKEDDLSLSCDDRDQEANYSSELPIADGGAKEERPPGEHTLHISQDALSKAHQTSDEVASPSCDSESKIPDVLSSAKIVREAELSSKAFVYPCSDDVGIICHEANHALKLSYNDNTVGQTLKGSNSDENPTLFAETTTWDSVTDRENVDSKGRIPVTPRSPISNRPCHDVTVNDKAWHQLSSTCETAHRESHSQADEVQLCNEGVYLCIDGNNDPKEDENICIYTQEEKQSSNGSATERSLQIKDQQRDETNIDFMSMQHANSLRDGNVIQQEYVSQSGPAKLDSMTLPDDSLCYDTAKINCLSKQAENQHLEKARNDVMSSLMKKQGLCAINNDVISMDDGKQVHNIVGDDKLPLHEKSCPQNVQNTKKTQYKASECPEKTQPLNLCESECLAEMTGETCAGREDEFNVSIATCRGIDRDFGKQDFSVTLRAASDNPKPSPRQRRDLDKSSVSIQVKTEEKNSGTQNVNRVGLGPGLSREELTPNDVLLSEEFSVCNFGHKKDAHDCNKSSPRPVCDAGPKAMRGDCPYPRQISVCIRPYRGSSMNFSVTSDDIATDATPLTTKESAISKAPSIPLRATQSGNNQMSLSRENIQAAYKECPNPANTMSVNEGNEPTKEDSSGRSEIMVITSSHSGLQPSNRNLDFKGNRYPASDVESFLDSVDETSDIKNSSTQDISQGSNTRNRKAKWVAHKIADQIKRFLNRNKVKSCEKRTLGKNTTKGSRIEGGRIKHKRSDVIKVNWSPSTPQSSKLILKSAPSMHEKMPSEISLLRGDHSSKNANVAFGVNFPITAKTSESTLYVDPAFEVSDISLGDPFSLEEPIIEKAEIIKVCDKPQMPPAAIYPTDKNACTLEPSDSTATVGDYSMLSSSLECFGHPCSHPETQNLQTTSHLNQGRVVTSARQASGLGCQGICAQEVPPLGISGELKNDATRTTNNKDTIAGVYEIFTDSVAATTDAALLTKGPPTTWNSVALSRSVDGRQMISSQAERGNECLVDKQEDQSGSPKLIPENLKSLESFVTNSPIGSNENGFSRDLDFSLSREIKDTEAYAQTIHSYSSENDKSANVEKKMDASEESIWCKNVGLPAGDHKVHNVMSDVAMSHYSTLDLSDDSFNSLFLENVVYLDATKPQSFDKTSRSPSDGLKPTHLVVAEKTLKKRRTNSLASRLDSRQKYRKPQSSTCSQDSLSSDVVQTPTVLRSPTSNRREKRHRSNRHRRRRRCHDNNSSPSEPESPFGRSRPRAKSSSAKDPPKPLISQPLSDLEKGTTREEQLLQKVAERDGEQEQATGEDDEDMDARRRRRLLERGAGVSSFDSPPRTSGGWRDRVYQKDASVHSSEDDLKNNNRDNQEEPRRGSWSRRSSEEAQSYGDATAVQTDTRMRRRQSEESVSSTVNERLARRRAMRREEQTSSSVETEVGGGRSVSVSGGYGDELSATSRGFRNVSSVVENGVEGDNDDDDETEDNSETKSRRRGRKKRESGKDGGRSWGIYQEGTSETDAGLGRRGQSSQDSSMSVDSFDDSVKASSCRPFRNRRRVGEGSATFGASQQDDVSCSSVDPDASYPWSSTESSFKTTSCSFGESVDAPAMDFHVGEKTEEASERSVYSQDYVTVASQEAEVPLETRPSIDKSDSDAVDGIDTSDGHQKTAICDEGVTSNVVSFRDRLNRMRGMDVELEDVTKSDLPTEQGDNTGKITPAPDLNTDYLPIDSPGPDDTPKQRQKRKDKSNLRKSPLNVNIDDDDDKNDNAGDPRTHLHTDAVDGENGTTVKDAKTPESTGRKKGEGTIVSQHALLWEKSTPTSTSHAQPRSNVPSYIMGDLSAKVSATRQKFSQNASTSSTTTLEAGSKQKAASESGGEGSPKRVHRSRTDFSQLLQKFSGSEASGSDKSDNEGATASGLARRALIRRQEARVVSSGSDSDAIFRRTPERTQSLKTSRDESRSSASPSKDARGLLKGVEKSSSFKSDFMTRRRTPNSPASTLSASSSNDNKTTPRERTSSNNASDSDSNVKPIDRKLDFRATLPDAHEGLPSASVNSSHDGEQRDPTSVKEDGREIHTITIQGHQASVAPTSQSSEDLVSKGITSETSTDVKQRDLTSSSTQNQLINRQTSGGSGENLVISSSSASTTLTAPTTTTGASSSIAVTASPHSPLSPNSTVTSSKVMWTSTPSLWAAENPAMSATGHTASGPSSGTDSTPGSTPRAGNGGIRRATSFRDVSNQLTSPEHPGPRKGILKRATSLSSKDVTGGCSPLLDPQLAKILQQRRQIQGDVDEEEEENDENEKMDENLVPSPRRRRSRAISAADEIEETLRYSQEKAAERGIDPDQDEALRRTSVAERVFSMQTKIEEHKVSPTSGSRSSLTSPRSRSRSGPTSPSQQRSLSQEDATSPTPNTSMSSSGSFLSQSLSSPAAISAAAAATTATTSSSSSTVSSASAPSPSPSSSSSSSHKTLITAVPSSSPSTSSASSLSQSSTTISTLSSSIATVTQSQSSPSLSSTRPAPCSATEHLKTSSADSSSSASATVAAPSSSSKDAERPVVMATDNGQASNTSSVMSSPQLLEKLTKIADASDAYHERRQKFATRGRDDWRRQSQPVTLEEIEAADSLETVNAFRSLIRKQTSINVFDQIQGQAKPNNSHTAAGSKKAEGFPQHIAPSVKLNRRSRKNRHKTLPVTAEELSAVPENNILANESLWSRGGTPGNHHVASHESKHDSGILSGSDVDSLLDGSSHNSDSLRSLTLEMDVGENDPSMMSVSAKASLFKSLDEKTKQDKSASGAKRYINRKKRERSQTMPITEDEVKTAAEIGDGKGTGAQGSRVPVGNLPQPEVVNRSKAVGEGQEADQEVQDDELTKLSLSDKVKLFSQRPDKEKESPKVETRRVVRRRSRKQASRFNTQPVTTEEVEKAAAYSRISPLAMSMVKPPDPEILKGLPLKDQRELMAQHAEICLSQTSSRSHSRSGSLTSLSQPSSRRDSLAVEQEELNAPGRSTTKDLQGVQSILKAESSSETEIHSILKQSTESTTSNGSPLTSVSAANEPRGILKKNKSEDLSADEAADDSVRKGILKTSASSSDEGESPCSRSRSNSQPSSILKSERRLSGSGVTGAASPSFKPRGILKAQSQEKVDEPAVVVKSAMRTESGPTTDLASSMTATSKSALKPSNEATDTGESEIVGENVAEKKESSLEVEDKASLSPDRLAPDLDGDKKKEGKEMDRKRDECMISSDDAGGSSGGEILEDTPTSTRSHRRSRFLDRKVKAERYKTQPPESLEEFSPRVDQEPGHRRKHKYEGRNKTQPITDGERRDAETSKAATGTMTSSTPGGSISDRLNQLKTSGEENWRKRVGKKEDIVTPAEKVKLREAKSEGVPRPSSIADRLTELQSSQKTWKDRVVEENDAVQFTPSNKMTTSCPAESPLLSKLKSKQKSEEQSTTSPATSPLNPSKEFISKIPLPKEIIQDTSVKVETTSDNSKATKHITPAGSVDEGENNQSVNVAVPKIGDDLEDFFATKSIHDIHDKVDMEIDDFNDIFIQAEMILPTTRKPRPARKTKSSHVNPLKTLSQTIELKEEYTQQSLGTAEKEFKRIKKEHLAKDAGFAQAALAGLASKENFKQVELRRSDSNSSAHGQRLDPFKEVMLLHIKGRRMVQTRLVRPHSRSLNAGDCFILVTSDKVIHWEGQYANVIEKAKASEIASFIQQKKDLGCKKAGEVHSVLQSKDHLGVGKLFWAALEGPKQVQECGPDAEDELYESSIVHSNMVYHLEGNALIPYEEYWGVAPKYEMLKKNEVIVFDFGTEFYLWQGKTVTMEQRKLGLRLAKQLYAKGYDYTESAINPFSPLSHNDEDAPDKAAVRPDWSIFGKVNQNMETILFREKFSDWPDSSRIIQCKGHENNDNVNKELQELQPFDAKRMIAPSRIPVTLKLEGADVGRGVKWSEDMQGFIKEQDIITLDVTAWHVLEYEHFKLPVESHGQFHDGDTYVVRWQYMISNANLRSLKGSVARNSLTGRERCAYFFWQGKNSTINEKGASALMTVELDEERGPQVRVTEGKEPPCFLNLFDGKMVLHIGKREEPESNTQGPWRLYCLRGEFENEMYLMEVIVCVENLRSRSSLVLLNVNTGTTYIWHGVKSAKHTRLLCRKIIENLKKNIPLELGLGENVSIVITEVEEGDESREMWDALGGKKNRKAYNSLIQDPCSYTHTMRLFLMSSVNMVFEVHEQLNPCRTNERSVPFPFLQSDLYHAIQPALFLLDCDQCVYLWQGWWPTASKDQENVHTGSATARFNMDRQLAMETTLNYCKEKNPDKPPEAFVVCAGVEPMSVISLFPHWEVNTAVQELAEEDGKSPGYMETVADVLHRLTQTRYTLAELQERPLPDGVDPLKLEAFLHDEEFEKYLEMSREEFYSQPSWKQLQVKQAVGLF